VDFNSIAGSLSGFAPMFFVFIIFYFIVLRPHNKKMAQHKESLANLKEGDYVIVNSNIMGVVGKRLTAKINKNEIDNKDSKDSKDSKDNKITNKNDKSKDSNDLAIVEIISNNSSIHVLLSSITEVMKSKQVIFSDDTK